MRLERKGGRGAGLAGLCGPPMAEEGRDGGHSGKEKREEHRGASGQRIACRGRANARVRLETAL